MFVASRWSCGMSCCGCRKSRIVMASIMQRENFGQHDDEAGYISHLPLIPNRNSIPTTFKGRQGKAREGEASTWQGKAHPVPRASGDETRHIGAAGRSRT